MGASDTVGPAGATVPMGLASLPACVVQELKVSEDTLGPCLPWRESTAGQPSKPLPQPLSPSEYEAFQSQLWSADRTPVPPQLPTGLGCLPPASCVCLAFLPPLCCGSSQDTPLALIPQL